MYCSAVTFGLSSSKAQLIDAQTQYSLTQLSNEKDVFPKPLTLDSCGHLAHGLAALV